MEKYAVPVAQIGENPRPITRSHWKRSRTELTGKSEGNCHHDISPLLIRSYSEIGAFRHAYHIDGLPCSTHMTSVYASPFPMLDLDTMEYSTTTPRYRQMGVSALEFDTKGIYLVSATRTGCLTVHDFESLYCQSNGSVQRPEEDEAKHLLHICLYYCIDVVRWNPTNQAEIACVSLCSDDVCIFDIGYISSEPIETLSKRPTVTVHGGTARRGLTDIAFLDDNSRVLASDARGVISIWDRRANHFPQTGLATNVNSGLTSIQLDGDQCVYGASKDGFIYVWDLRGGRSSAAFQSHDEVHSSPITSVRLASMLNKIELLKAQSKILSKEIQSIDINPSCPYQLGFHLEDGWSGVLDMHNFQVTHIHCPPPPWLDATEDNIPISSTKPSWLPEHSIYAVGSYSSNGIHLLDFYPNTSSSCHVDHDESKNAQGSSQRKQNKFLPLSGRVTACTTHPLNGTIVAGTRKASLLMISQKHISYKNEYDGDGDGDGDADADAAEG